MAFFLSMLHALGLDGIECLQARAKGVPVKTRKGRLSEEGMQLGENGVLLQLVQQDLVVSVVGGWDGACQVAGFRVDHFLVGFTN